MVQISDDIVRAGMPCPRRSAVYLLPIHVDIFHVLLAFLVFRISSHHKKTRAQYIGVVSFMLFRKCSSTFVSFDDNLMPLIAVIS